MSPRRFSIPHRLWIALALTCGVSALPPLGCRPAAGPALPESGPRTWPPADDALGAPSREFLAHRLALVEAGELAEAHARWAERVLLPRGSAPPDTREGVASQQLLAAIRAYEHTNRSGPATERLAQACDRAGWFRDARLVLERGPGSGSLTPAAEGQRTVLRNIDRLAAALDSLVLARARTEPGLAVTTSPAPIGSAARTVTRGLGITSEALRAHGLLLSIRPEDRPDRPDRIELAVVAMSEGPLTLTQDGATFQLRRVVLDDNAIFEPDPVELWDSASLWEVEDGVVSVYHRRDYLRTAAVVLFHELESAGGAAARSGKSQPDSVVARNLRLASVLPLFDRARAEVVPRSEIVRRFAIEYVNARMLQGEAAAGRHWLDERKGLTPADGEEEAARRLLAVLRFAPLPRLALADAIDRAARETGDEAQGARSVLRALAARAGGTAGPEATHPLAALGEDRLRTLATELDLGPALNP